MDSWITFLFIYPSPPLFFLIGQCLFISVSLTSRLFKSFSLFILIILGFTYFFSSSYIRRLFYIFDFLFIFLFVSLFYIFCFYCLTCFKSNINYYFCQYCRIHSEPLQHRLVKILPSKKADSILKSISLNKRRIYLCHIVLVRT